MFPGESRPSRGAWIEIVFPLLTSCFTSSGRAPHGARGLKFRPLVRAVC